MTEHAQTAADGAAGPRRVRRGWVARLGLRRGAAGEGPLRREADGQIFGGVAAGLARRTGFDVALVRAVLVVAALVTSGYVAAAYVVAWLLIPARETGSSIASKAVADRRGMGLSAAVVSVLVAAFVVASALHATWVTSVSAPLIVCAAGLVLITRNAPDPERQYLQDMAGPAGLTSTAPRSRRLLRIAVALVLLIAGLSALLTGQAKDAELLRPVTGIVLLIGSILLGFGPWWLRIVRGAGAERQARIRAEERAEMASRVHDSVLQTLALIQRRAQDPQQVMQLARAQERELRAWLFDGRPPGSLDGQATSVAGAVRLIQQEVEAQHGITVEAVIVGDCELDEELTALLDAAREAAVNAAKWSGASVVSVFAEIEPEMVSVYVRDRGRGFDLDAVPKDRKGLAESVQARVRRRGGTATVRSAPGEGTEISLVMPRLAATRAGRT